MGEGEGEGRMWGEEVLAREAAGPSDKALAPTIMPCPPTPTPTEAHLQQRVETVQHPQSNRVQQCPSPPPTPMEAHLQQRVKVLPGNAAGPGHKILQGSTPTTKSWPTNTHWKLTCRSESKSSREKLLVRVTKRRRGSVSAAGRG